MITGGGGPPAGSTNSGTVGTSHGSSRPSLTHTPSWTLSPVCAALQGRPATRTHVAGRPAAPFSGRDERNGISITTPRRCGTSHGIGPFGVSWSNDGP